MSHGSGKTPAPFRAERRRVLRLAAALPVAGLAAACQIPVPGQAPPPTIYRLTPKSSFPADLPQVDWQLLVEPPLANAAIDTTRIALQRTPIRIEYYARSGWADRAPNMVHSLIVESFENSNKIISIGREAVGLRADFILKLDLREFQAEYFNSEQPQAHVAITVRLIKMPRRAIVGTETFDAVATAKADSVPDVIQAFDEALGKVLRRLVTWTLRTGEAARVEA